MPIRILPASEKRKARRGQFRKPDEKSYHDKTTLHKSQRHPHSRLKTQKEYKAITDSSDYKKADYHTQNKMLKKHPTTMKAGGTVTRFRSSGPEGKPHSTKEGRSAEAQRAYMRQHGPQEPRRKRIWPKRAAKAKGGPSTSIGRPPKISIRDRLKESRGGRKSFFEDVGGSEKAKPHSSKEGRTAAGERRIRRILKRRPKTMEQRPLPTWPKQNSPKIPLRAKKAVGGIAKIIGKKAVDWIKKNKKTIKKEVYSPEGKKKTQQLTKKLQEGMKRPGHAKGGRIGLKHGDWVKAPTPHADISKYVDTLSGKEDTRGKRSRKEGSTLEFKKPKKSRGPSATRRIGKGLTPAAGRQAARTGYKHGSRGPHGFGPKPYLNKPGQSQGTHGGKIAKASDKALRGNKLTKTA